VLPSPPAFLLNAPRHRALSTSPATAAADFTFASTRAAVAGLTAADVARRRIMLLNENVK